MPSSLSKLIAAELHGVLANIGASGRKLGFSAIPESLDQNAILLAYARWGVPTVQANRRPDHRYHWIQPIGRSPSSMRYTCVGSLPSIRGP